MPSKKASFVVHKSGPQYISSVRLFSINRSIRLSPGLSLPIFLIFFHGSLPATKVSSAHRNPSQGYNLASVQGYSPGSIHADCNNEKLETTKMSTNNSTCLSQGTFFDCSMFLYLLFDSISKW